MAACACLNPTTCRRTALILSHPRSQRVEKPVMFSPLFICQLFFLFSWIYGRISSQACPPCLIARLRHVCLLCGKSCCNTSLSNWRSYPLSKAFFISSRERELVGRKGIEVREAYMTKSSSCECSCASSPSLSSDFDIALASRNRHWACWGSLEENFATLIAFRPKESYWLSHSTSICCKNCFCLLLISFYPYYAHLNAGSTHIMKTASHPIDSDAFHELYWKQSYVRVVAVIRI
jgi:hypothetical protein